MAAECDKLSLIMNCEFQIGMISSLLPRHSSHAAKKEQCQQQQPRCAINAEKNFQRMALPRNSGRNQIAPVASVQNIPKYLKKNLEPVLAVRFNCLGPNLTFISGPKGMKQGAMAAAIRIQRKCWSQSMIRALQRSRNFRMGRWFAVRTDWNVAISV